MSESSDSCRPGTSSGSGIMPKDSDVTGWMECKFGVGSGPDDLWNKNVPSGLITNETLDSLDSCFHDLQPATKLRILAALLQCTPRTIELVESSAQRVIDLACEDAEDWVNTIAKLMKHFCVNGGLSYALANQDTHFARTVHELTLTLKSRVESSSDGQLHFVPLHSAYLTRTACSAECPNSEAVNRPQSTTQFKHFTLIRKPKSAVLRAELLAKAADLANQHKPKNPLLNQVTSPNRSLIKKINDNAPLRAIPTANALKLSKGFSSEPKKDTRPFVKKEGGAKLIDLSETPQQLRKKRKLEEAAQKDRAKQRREEEKKRAQEDKEQQKRDREDQKLAKLKEKQEAADSMKQNTKQNRTLDNAPLQQTEGDGDTLNETVDTESEAAASILEDSNQDTATPDYAAAAILPAQIRPTARVAPHAQYQPAMSIPYSSPRPPTYLPPSFHQNQIPDAQRVMDEPRAAGLGLAYPANQRPAAHMQAPINPAQAQPARPMNAPQQVQYMNAPANQQQAVGQARLIRAPNQLNNNAQQAQRSQMEQAQEMFRTANRLSRPEKALILGFMAGNRENPCPGMGHVLTVRLSEQEANEVLPNAAPNAAAVPCIIETFFQMNYENGEWKRLRKVRPAPNQNAQA